MDLTFKFGLVIGGVLLAIISYWFLRFLFMGTCPHCAACGIWVPDSLSIAVIDMRSEDY